MRTLLSFLLFAGALLAQEIDRGAIDMMPGLEREQRAALYRALGKPAEMEKALAGMDPAAVARLRAMPKGDLREERYNHGVLLEIPDLTSAQRERLAAMAIATDAAQRALIAQRRRFDGAPAPEAEARRRLQGSLDRQRYETEQRFWQAAHFLLEPQQVRWARVRLSPRSALVREPEQQIYLIEGLTPSQATRVKALFTEHGSESAADEAATRAIRARLQDRKLPAAERLELQREAAEAGQRLAALNEGLGKSVRGLFTPEQMSEFDATPLLLGMGQRAQPAPRLFASLGLSREGAALAAEIQKQFQREQAELQKGMGSEYGSMMEAGLGPESPQQMTMESMRRQAYGRVLDRMRAAGQRYLLEILSAGQIARWIVDPSPIS